MNVCNICDSEVTSLALLIDAPDRFEMALGIQSTAYKRAWYDCPKCRALVNIRNDTETLDKIASHYYEIDLRNTNLLERYNTIMSLPVEKSDNVQRVNRIQNFYKKFLEDYRFKLDASFRILDVGAGTGVFLKRFLLNSDKIFFHEWKATAVEPDPDAAKHLTELGSFSVINECFSAELGLEGFHICTLNKILEHIEDPENFLKGISGVVNDIGGIIYVEVPDKSTAYCRPATDNILGSLHYNLYDFITLNYLFEQAGLCALEFLKIYEPSGKVTLSAFATTKKTIQHLEKNFYD